MSNEVKGQRSKTRNPYSEAAAAERWLASEDQQMADRVAAEQYLAEKRMAERQQEEWLADVLMAEEGLLPPAPRPVDTKQPVPLDIKQPAPVDTKHPPPDQTNKYKCKNHGWLDRSMFRESDINNRRNECKECARKSDKARRARIPEWLNWESFQTRYRKKFGCKIFWREEGLKIVRPFLQSRPPGTPLAGLKVGWKEGTKPPLALEHLIRIWES